MATVLLSLGSSILPALGNLFAAGGEKISATEAEEKAMSAWTQLAYRPEAGQSTVADALQAMDRVYQAVQQVAQSDPRLVTSATTHLAGYLGPAAAGGGGVGGLIPAASKTWQYISGHLPADGSIDQAYAVFQGAARIGAPASASGISAGLESILGGTIPGGGTMTIVLIIGVGIAVAVVGMLIQRGGGGGKR